MLWAASRRGHRGVDVGRQTQQLGSLPVAPDMRRVRFACEPNGRRHDFEHRFQFRRSGSQGVGGFAPNAGHFEVRIDPSDQLARRERLGEVVVCAGIQTLDACLFPGPGGHDDNGEIAKAAPHANMAVHANRANPIVENPSSTQPIAQANAYRPTPLGRASSRGEHLPKPSI